jgi:hypothetical protein
MHDDLVRIGRILANATDTKLQQLQIVPAWDDDGKHGRDKLSSVV